MNNNTLHSQTPQESLALASGVLGFKRIADTAAHVAGAGAHTDVNEFVAVIAVAATTTFAAGNVASIGDAPAATDAIPQSAYLKVRLTTLKLAGGAVYAYYK